MIKSFGIASVTALSLMLIPLAHGADAASPPSATTQTTKPAGKNQGFPEMKRAHRALENAKHDLEKAAHDFGGHRAKALELTTQAIKEIDEGIEVAKNEAKEYKKGKK
ncbi:MAG TPA: hypothetical protein VK138_11900 [Acidiferrobacterales bacterium]|nr:hypothetical protein [Acidiferrobacterales bacterium]